MSQTQMQQVKEDVSNTVQVYDEMKVVFSTDDDDEFKYADDQVEAMNSISLTIEERENKLKQTLEAITLERDEELDALKSESDKTRSGEVLQATKNLTSAEEHRKQVEEQLQATQEKLSEQDTQIENLEQKRLELDQKVKKGVSSARHDLNLYQYLTGIKWQSDSDPHEVKGYISAKKKVKTFSLNNLQNSQFFIANYLWDQIEEDW